MRDSLSIIKMIRNWRGTRLRNALRSADGASANTSFKTLFWKHSGTMWIHAGDCSDSHNLKAWSLQQKKKDGCWLILKQALCSSFHFGINYCSIREANMGCTASPILFHVAYTRLGHETLEQFSIAATTDLWRSGNRMSILISYKPRRCHPKEIKTCLCSVKLRLK